MDPSSHLQILSPSGWQEPCDEECAKRPASPGFGALFESLVLSEQNGEGQEERRRREAETLALCVGLSAVGRQDNGAGEEKSWDRPPDDRLSPSQIRDISNGETGEREGRNDGEESANGSLSLRPSDLEDPLGSTFGDNRQPSDRAMVAVLEELVRQLHGASMATRSSAALVVSLGDLGEVKIDVRFHGKTMLVRAEVSDSRAAAVLTSAVPHLRDRLGAIGWRLGRLELYEKGRAPRAQSAPTEQNRPNESRTVDGAVVAHNGTLDVQA